MVAAPTNDTLTSLTWVWPPALLALVVWMAVQVRRSLTGPRPLAAHTGLRLPGGRQRRRGARRTSPPTRNQDAYPAPGTTYSVGDHRLHLDCRGEGGPTVVLFNGLGEISDSWAKVTAELGSDTRVCAYDRAGQAWSDDVASAPGRDRRRGGPPRAPGRRG